MLEFVRLEDITSLVAAAVVVVTLELVEGLAALLRAPGGAVPGVSTSSSATMSSSNADWQVPFLLCAGATGGIPDLTYSGYSAVVLEAVHSPDSDEAAPAFMG